MPVSIVVGGQFGSEGKGKVALEIARRSKEPVTVVRVGGPNSGHTAYDRQGRKYALRQMPAGSVDGDVDVVFPAGFYVDPDLLFAEIACLRYPKERIRISPFARVITEEHRQWERRAGLVTSIGSTGSGVGAAVIAAAARGASNVPLRSPQACDFAPLEEFLQDSSELLRKRLEGGHRVIIEGTQGFGLSLLEGGFWPKATSRSTTAAGALSECGLSPLDVDDVTLVIRAFPIRVAGDSGPLAKETSWEKIAEEAGLHHDIREHTTVTRRIRRVGHFDFTLVHRAVSVNKPSRMVVNHLDYLGSMRSARVSRFIESLESEFGSKEMWFGFSPKGFMAYEDSVDDLAI